MVVYVVVIFIPNNLNNKDNINTRIWITMQFDRAQRRRRLRASTVIATPEARAGRRPDFVRKTMQASRRPAPLGQRIRQQNRASKRNFHRANVTRTQDRRQESAPEARAGRRSDFVRKRPCESLEEGRRLVIGHARKPCLEEELSQQVYW